MFKLNSVGRKLYFSVLAVFLVFAVSFIVFQQAREKQYKIGTLTIKLENYNELLAEDLALSPGEGIILQDSIHNRDVTVAHEKLKAFVREHESKDLRVTLVRPNGKVIYDNMSSDYDQFANHAKREEIAEALKNRVGSSVERQSKTLKHDYFYVASYFPESKLIIRTALPYNNDLAKSLQADQHFIWFAKLLRNHIDGIISHAEYPLSNGKVEGINQKIKTIRRKSYGLSDDEYFFLKLFDASRQKWKAQIE